MALSVERNVNGPVWPVGLATVAASGTPVNVMKAVDSTLGNAPESSAPTITGEYPVRCQQIIFQALKSVAPVVQNVGPAYVLIPPAAGGTGNKTDSGALVKVLAPGETFILGAAALSHNVFNPYQYLIDADNAGDGVLVTLLIMG